MLRRALLPVCGEKMRQMASGAAYFAEQSLSRVVDIAAAAEKP
jgi:hypothetical protein